MTKLEKAGYVSVIAVCALAAYVLVDAEMRRPSISGRTTASPMLGKKLGLAGAQWSGRHLNLVIAMTTKCHYCVASLPFYQRLNEAVQASEFNSSLQIATSEPVETTRTFLLEQQVPIQRIVQTSFQAIGVSGTPTIFVVDATGLVKRAYRGKLNGKQESEVLGLVRQGHT